MKVVAYSWHDLIVFTIGNNKNKNNNKEIS